MSALLISLCLAAVPATNPFPVVQLDIGAAARASTINEDTFSFITGLRVGVGLDFPKRDTGFRAGLLFRGSSSGVALPFEAGGFLQIDVLRPLQLDNGTSLALFVGIDGLARHIGGPHSALGGLLLFTAGLRIIGISIGAIGGFDINQGRSANGVLEMRIGFELFELWRGMEMIFPPKDEKAPW